MKQALHVFCPLPPTRSGIADYLFEQVPFLADVFDLTIVVEDRIVDSVIADLPARVVRIDEYREGNRFDEDVERLYHLGNNPHHEFVFHALQEAPGTLVLHDYVQHHLVTAMTLARGDRDEYIRFLEEDMGELGRDLAQARIDGKWADIFHFLVPANAPAIQRANKVIVHSSWAERHLLARFPELEVRRIPHHYSAPADDSALDRASARQRLGIDSGEIVFASLGFITRPKKIEMILGALASVRESLGDFRYCLVGEPQDERGLHKLVERLGLKDNVDIVGYVDIDVMQDYIAAADLIFNLRYPTAGETSGTLVRAVGQGRAALVFDYASFTDYPDDVVIKVPVDIASDEDFGQRILECLQPGRIEQLESRAREYVHREHDITRCVQDYIDFIRR